MFENIDVLFIVGPILLVTVAVVLVLQARISREQDPVKKALCYYRVPELWAARLKMIGVCGRLCRKADRLI